MKQGNNVRLLGNTTGRGSGYSKKIDMPYSGIRIRLSRMFSYQPDGQLYDGHGVIPDIFVYPILDDFLNQKDQELEKAIELLMH